MTSFRLYQHSLIIIGLLLYSLNLLSQKNEIEVQSDQEHGFNITQPKNEHDIDAILLSINDDLDEREVVEVLRDASGLLWIIQRQVIHLYDENAIIESHYFDIKNQHIQDAFIFSDNTLVLIGDNRSIGLLHIKDRIARKINYSNLPDNHKKYKIIDNTIYSLQSKNGEEYSIQRFSVDQHRQANWNTVYQHISKDDIKDFHYDESSQEFAYISNGSQFVKIDPNGQTSKAVEHIDDGFSKAAKIIHYENGYFLFFSSRQGLFWYEKTNQQELIQLTEKGMYGYHKFDNHKQLLLGIRTKPLTINTVLQISNKTIKYKQFGFDFDTTIDAYSSNFEKEIILYGGNGIYHFSPSSLSQKGIIKHISDDNKTNFSYGEIITDVQVHNNLVYAVSESTGQLFVNNKNAPNDIGIDTFTSIYRNKDLFLHKLCSDTLNNVLWVSAFDQKRHGSLYKYSDSKMEKELQTDIIIRRVIPYSKSTLLLFGFRKSNQNIYGIIYLYNLESKKLDLIFNKLNYDIWTVSKIKSKFLCGTKTALFEFDPTSKKMSVVDALDQQRVSSIRAFNDAIYICTRSNGIYILDDSLHLKRHLDFTKQPISNRVTDIILDSNNNFWVSTFKGIALLNNEYNFLKRLTIKDGLSSWEFNSFATDTLDNSIFFGSLNGLTEIVLPAFYSATDNQVRLYNMKGYYQNDYHSPTIDGMSYTYNFTPKELVFDSYYKNKASPQANFAHLSVLKDGETIDIEHTNNSVRISGMTTGQYDLFQSTLKNETVKIAEINIKPNYSQLFEFIIYGLFIAVLCFLIARYWITRQNKLLIEKTELENRLTTIKLESLRSQLNPHFVFNCLNSIQYYIQMNEKVLARDYLAKFSKLMRYFLESSRNDKLPVTEEINLLTLYLDLEKLRFENKFDYNISNSLNTDQHIPTMILQPHVENAIVHGISHLEDRVGHIDIKFSQLANGLECTIIDNGIGREAAQKIKLRKKGNHKSRATQIIDERMTILNSQGSGETKINYHDKLDKYGKVIGTIAHIKFIQN